MIRDARPTDSPTSTARALLLDLHITTSGSASARDSGNPGSAMGTGLATIGSSDLLKLLRQE